MKKLLAGLLAFCSCLSLGFAALPGAIDASAASTHVGMIVTNPAEDSSTAMNVGFHADLGYTSCYVQYTTLDDTSWANAKTQTGNYVTYGASESTNPFYNKYAKDDAGTNIYQTPTFLDYSVTLTGLIPATEYMYRVCDGSAYSDTYKFKTAGADEWTFVVTGDFHEYYANYGVDRAGNGTKAINAAISLAAQKGYPAVEHIVSVGDIVAWGVDYGQWKNVMAQPWIKNYSFANCIGNHDDMDRSSNSSSAYNAIVFNNPQNGYGDEMGTCYYYLYNDVLFIYINYLDPSATAEAWADGVVQKMAGQYKYSVLVNHRPATSKYNGKTYSYFWNYWADFCDRNHIDLVLAGDHHVYMRSQPLYNGSMLSGYSASNPDATVYIAGDSSDGERGSSTDVVSFNSSYVASNYYRYNYSSSTKDITSILIHVGKDKMTTNFVYYENSSSATHPSFKEGSVSGHSSFYYGDTSYVYPSDHGYQENAGGSDSENGLPAAAKDYLASANGGTYMYPTTNYPGTASYYTYDYYGDNANQGGSYFAGKLNDGVLPADSNPGSSNTAFAVLFASGGTPVVTLKLSEAIYLNNLSIVYRYSGYYSDVTVASVQISSDGASFVTTAAYTSAKQTVSGSNQKLTLSFTSPVQARYIKLTLGGVSADATRYALGEMQVWGDTTLPVVESFELVDESEYTLDEENVTLNAPMIVASDVAAQFKCEVSVLNSKGEAVAETAMVGTGFKVVRYDGNGEVLNSAVVVVSGDADGDAAITNTDYLAVKSKVKADTAVSDCYTKACDVNVDGDISSVDILAIATYVARG